MPGWFRTPPRRCLGDPMDALDGFDGETPRTLRIRAAFGMALAFVLVVIGVWWVSVGGNTFVEGLWIPLTLVVVGFSLQAGVRTGNGGTDPDSLPPGPPER